MFMYTNSNIPVNHTAPKAVKRNSGKSVFIRMRTQNHQHMRGRHCTLYIRSIGTRSEGQSHTKGFTPYTCAMCESPLPHPPGVKVWENILYKKKNNTQNVSRFYCFLARCWFRTPKGTLKVD